MYSLGIGTYLSVGHNHTLWVIHFWSSEKLKKKLKIFGTHDIGFLETQFLVLCQKINIKICEFRRKTTLHTKSIHQH